jgi:hypothetical protein
VLFFWALNMSSVALRRDFVAARRPSRSKTVVGHRERERERESHVRLVAVVRVQRANVTTDETAERRTFVALVARERYFVTLNGNFVKQITELVARHCGPLVIKYVGLVSHTAHHRVHSVHKSSKDRHRREKRVQALHKLEMYILVAKA